MLNREMKLKIGDELQTLFHPIVNATNQAGEETRKELAPMKKTLTDIDGALAAQRDASPPTGKTAVTKFGLYRKQYGPLSMGNKAVQLDVNRKTLTIDDTEYKLMPGLGIDTKHPQPDQYNPNDLKVYRSLIAHSKVKSFPNRTDSTWPHT